MTSKGHPLLLMSDEQEREWRAVLEWYAGRRSVEGRIGDGGDRAERALLKFPGNVVAPHGLCSSSDGCNNPVGPGKIYCQKCEDA